MLAHHISFAHLCKLVATMALVWLAWCCFCLSTAVFVFWVASEIDGRSAILARVLELTAAAALLPLILETAEKAAHLTLLARSFGSGVAERNRHREVRSSRFRTKVPLRFAADPLRVFVRLIRLDLADEVRALRLHIRCETARWVRERRRYAALPQPKLWQVRTYYTWQSWVQLVVYAYELGVKDRVLCWLEGIRGIIVRGSARD